MDNIKLLENAVRENAREQSAYLMLIDALQEAGKTPLAAKRRANAVQREGLDKWLIAQAVAMLNEDTARGRRMRKRVRENCGHSCGNHVPFTVQTAGYASPTFHGAPGYSEFRGGGICAYPSSARRAGYKVVYVPSTEVVFVHARWLLTESGEEIR